MAVILAIESSCDEMSVAILKDGKELLSHVVASQIDINMVGLFLKLPAVNMLNVSALF